MIENYADHSANERTFLAWVRTAVAIVGFGIAAARLGPAPAALWSEVAMIAAGAVVVALAYLRLRHTRKLIRAQDRFEDDAVAADGLLLLLLGALLALLAFFAIHAG